MSSGSAEKARLREAVLDALPNRCCEDWRTCPYDQHDAAELLATVRPFLKKAWDDGQTDGYRGAHSSFNRYAHIERAHIEDNPWCDGEVPADCGCVFHHENRSVPPGSAGDS